jgi:hypothetical protein
VSAAVPPLLYWETRGRWQVLGETGEEEPNVKELDESDA